MEIPVAALPSAHKSIHNGTWAQQVWSRSIGSVTMQGKQRQTLYSKAKLQQREANCIKAEYFQVSM